MATIGKKRSEDIRAGLARIERLLEDIGDEIVLLRDHLWAEVDLSTAVAMDAEDGLDPFRGGRDGEVEDGAEEAAAQ